MAYHGTPYYNIPVVCVRRRLILQGSRKDRFQLKKNRKIFSLSGRVTFNGPPCAAAAYYYYNNMLSSSYRIGAEQRHTRRSRVFDREDRTRISRVNHSRRPSLSIGIMPYRSSSFFPSVARNRITIRRTRAGTHYYNDDAYLYNIFITARLQDRTIVEQRTKSPQNVYGNIHAIRCFPKSFRRNSRTHSHAPRAEKILAQLSVQKYYHFIHPLVHAWIRAQHNIRTRN